MEGKIKKTNLKEAVTNIRMACDRVRPNQRTPYFFLVGAGVSFPPIPLASKLVERFKERAAGYGKSAGPASRQAVDEYSHWFEQAYPDRIDRQQFLQDQMRDQIISQANLRLAHLLMSKRISNLVITPNFDDFLTRALQLFGKQHITCDHPLTLDRVDFEQGDDIQIIHVHGTYWFYDCVNLTGEMDRRATEGAYITMSFLLEQILNRRSPLVIGYSGWEGDLIMKALKKRLSVSSLPRTIYWFCYRKENIDLLPDWLKFHEAVVFVVPPEDSSSGLSAEPSEPEPAASSRGSRPTPIEAKKITEAEASAPTLPAQQVLDALINDFKLEAPKLTRDPLGFLVEQLKVSLPKPDLARGETDIYFINSVIDRIERARQRETEEAAAMQEIEEWIEGIRDAVRRSQYNEAIEQAGYLPVDDLDDLTDDYLRALMDTMWSAAFGLSGDPEDEVSGFDQVISIADILLERGLGDPALREKIATSLESKGEALSEMGRQEEALAAYDQVIKRFGEATEPTLREQVAKALFNKGILFGDMGRIGEEIEQYNEIVRRYDGASEAVLLVQVAKALFNKGVTLYDHNRHEEATAVYDEIINLFGEATDPALRENVAGALINKGTALNQQGQHEEAVAAYDEVIKRFGEATDPALLENVAMALFNKGAALEDQSRTEEAVAAYDEVIKRFSEATDPALLENVAMALFNKGTALNQQGQHEEAVAVYDQVIKRFGEATDPTLHDSVARALINKGTALEDQSRTEEALAAYDEVIKRFSKATDPTSREHVGVALNGISFINLCKAKQSWVNGDEASARALLTKVLEQIKTARERRPADPVILGNLGYTLFLLGQKDEARTVLTEAIALGGEELRQTELDDSNIHPLPQDEEFRELVRSIPAPAVEA